MTERAGFLTALATNALWINLSEVVRYFALVMPMMREAFPGLDVAPMNLSVFALWALWDMLLIVAVTGGAWIAFDRFGAGAGVALKAATALWLGIFGILWLGLWNLNLATPAILLAALPWAWAELVVAVFLTRRRHIPPAPSGVEAA